MRQNSPAVSACEETCSTPPAEPACPVTDFDRSPVALGAFSALAVRHFEEQLVNYARGFDIPGFEGEQARGGGFAIAWCREGALHGRDKKAGKFGERLLLYPVSVDALRWFVLYPDDSMGCEAMGGRGVGEEFVLTNDAGAAPSIFEESSSGSPCARREWRLRSSCVPPR